jgi:6-phosphogluconolactonase/glucosamine-6-phosphate isomerase/deaminase
MLYIKVKDPLAGGQYLARALKGALDEDLKVLWLVSGGSNAAVACEVRRVLPANRLKNLKVALVDERYGNYEHKDSNYAQLQQVGFDFTGINFKPVLTNQNLSFEQTIKNYQERVQRLFRTSDIIIGQFGVGNDGHTAGILPHSKATRIDAQLVVGYRGPDFDRITLSFTAIKRINEAYVFVFGEDKRATLNLLHQKDQSLTDQPAQIFRQYSAKSFIINNMIGDSK